MTTRLSSLQYAMLKLFAMETKDYRMNIQEAGQFRQDSFRSMLIRKYVIYERRPNSRNKFGFAITDEGRAAYREFEQTNILRQVPSMHLTKYFQMPSAVHLFKRKKSA